MVRKSAYWVFMVFPLLVPFWTSPEAAAEVARHLESGGREGPRQPGAHRRHVDDRDVDRAGGRLGDELPEPLGPEDVHAPRPEGAADERPVRPHEAQGAGHRDRRVVDGGTDEVDLLEDAVHELRAVAATDDEDLGPRAEEPALDAQGRTAPVLLGVDDEHAAAGDDEVVEVGPRPRDAPVVQDRKPVADQGVEPGADDLLAFRARVPGPGALWLLGDGEEEAADARVALAHALLPRVAPPLELASRRRARRSRCSRQLPRSRQLSRFPQ